MMYKTKTTRMLSHLVPLILVLAMILSAAPALAAPGVERTDVLIGWRERPGLAAQNLVQGLGGNIRHSYRLIPVTAVSLPANAIEALRGNPNVAFVEPDFVVTATSQSVPWGIARVFGAQTYPFATWGTTRGAGVRVAVLDTGIASHADLAVAGGVNTIDTTPWNSDIHGHGTHVAGTIAALDNTVGVVGVAPNISLYSVKVLSDSGSGTVSSVVAGIDWAVAQGIPIINMSLASSGTSESLRLACEAAYAAGRLLIASAGNQGTVDGTGDNVGFPALYSSVIAVAASTSSNTRASYSSTGPAIELIAPGSGILSTAPNNSYTTRSGTSMAAPHVSGAAALVWAARPELTNAQVRSILQQSAENLGLPATHQGHGLVRADQAVAMALASQPVAPAPAVSVGVSTDQSTYERAATTALLTAVVTNERGERISGLASSAFVTTVGGAASAVNWTESATAGSYTGALGLASLAEGQHQVQVTVTDTRGISGSGSATFAIAPAPAPTPAPVTMRVAAMEGTRVLRNSNRRWEASVTVTIRDSLDRLVPSATVTAEWSGARTGTVSGVTGSTGAITFRTGNMSGGTSVTLTVRNVTHATFLYTQPAQAPSLTVFR